MKILSSAPAVCQNSSYTSLCTFWNSVTDPSTNPLLPVEAPIFQFYYLFAMIQAAEIASNNYQVPTTLCAQNSVVCAIINSNATQIEVNNQTTTSGIIAAKLQAMAAIQWMAKNSNSYQTYTETDFTSLLTSSDPNAADFVKNIVTIQSDNSNNFYLGMDPQTIMLLWDEYVMPFYTYITKSTAPPLIAMTVDFYNNTSETITVSAGVFNQTSIPTGTTKGLQVLSTFSGSFTITGGTDFEFNINLTMASISPVENTPVWENQQYFQTQLTFTEGAGSINYAITIGLPTINIINNTSNSVTVSSLSQNGISGPITAGQTGKATLTSLPTKTPFIVTDANKDFSFDVDLVDITIKPSANAAGSQLNFGGSIVFDSMNVVFTVTIRSAMIQFANNTPNPMTVEGNFTGIVFSGSNCTNSSCAIPSNKTVSGSLTSFFPVTSQNQVVTVTGAWGDLSTANSGTFSFTATMVGGINPTISTPGVAEQYSTTGAFISSTSTYVIGATDTSVPPAPTNPTQNFINFQNLTGKPVTIRGTQLAFTGTELTSPNGAADFSGGVYTIQSSCNPCKWTIPDASKFGNFQAPAVYQEHEYNYFLVEDSSGNWFYFNFLYREQSKPQYVAAYSANYESLATANNNSLDYLFSYDDTKATYTITIPQISTLAKSSITFNNSTPYAITVNFPSDFLINSQALKDGSILSLVCGDNPPPCFPGLVSSTGGYTIKPFAINTIVEYDPTKLSGISSNIQFGFLDPQGPPVSYINSQGVIAQIPNPAFTTSLSNASSPISDVSGQFELLITEDENHNFTVDVYVDQSTNAQILTLSTSLQNVSFTADESDISAFSGPTITSSILSELITLVDLSNNLTLVSKGLNQIYFNAMDQGKNSNEFTVSLTSQIITPPVPGNSISLLERGTNSNSFAAYHLVINQIGQENASTLTFNFDHKVIGSIAMQASPLLIESPPSCMVLQNPDTCVYSEATCTYVITTDSTKSCQTMPNLNVFNDDDNIIYLTEPVKNSGMKFSVQLNLNQAPVITNNDTNYEYNAVGNYDNKGNYSISIAKSTKINFINYVNQTINITPTTNTSFQGGALYQSTPMTCQIPAGSFEIPSNNTVVIGTLPTTTAVQFQVQLMGISFWMTFDGEDPTGNLNQSDTQNVTVSAEYDSTDGYKVTIQPSLVTFNNASGETLSIDPAFATALSSLVCQNEVCTASILNQVPGVTFKLGNDSFTVDFTQNPVQVTSSISGVSITVTSGQSVPTVISIASVAVQHTITFINNTDYPIQIEGINQGTFSSPGCINLSNQIPANTTAKAKCTATFASGYTITELTSFNGLNTLSPSNTVFSISVSNWGTNPSATYPPTIVVKPSQDTNGNYTLEVDPATITINNSSGSTVTMVLGGSDKWVASPFNIGDQGVSEPLGTLLNESAAIPFNIGSVEQFTIDFREPITITNSTGDGVITKATMSEEPPLVINVAALPVEQSITIANHTYFPIAIVGTTANSFEPGFAGITCPSSGNCYVNGGPNVTATLKFVNLPEPVYFSGANTDFSVAFTSDAEYTITPSNSQNFSVSGGNYAITLVQEAVEFTNTSGKTFTIDASNSSDVTQLSCNGLSSNQACSIDVIHLKEVTFHLGSDSFTVDFNQNPVVVTSSIVDTSVICTSQQGQPTSIAIAPIILPSVTFTNTTGYPITIMGLGPQNKYVANAVGLVSGNQIPANTSNTPCEVTFASSVTAGQLGLLLQNFNGINTSNVTVFTVSGINFTQSPIDLSDTHNVSVSITGTWPNYTIGFAPATVTFVNTTDVDLVVTADSGAFTSVSGGLIADNPNYTISSSCSGLKCYGVVGDLLDLNAVSVALSSAPQTSIFSINFAGLAPTIQENPGYSASVTPGQNGVGTIITLERNTANIGISLTGSVTQVVRDQSTPPNNILFVTGPSMDSVNHKALIQLNYTAFLSSSNSGNGSCNPPTLIPGITSMSDAKVFQGMSTKPMSITLAVNTGEAPNENTFANLTTTFENTPIANTASIEINGGIWENPDETPKGNLTISSAIENGKGDWITLINQNITNDPVYINPFIDGMVFVNKQSISGSEPAELSLSFITNWMPTETISLKLPKVLATIYPYIAFNTGSVCSTVGCQNNNYIIFTDNNSFEFNLAFLETQISNGMVNIQSGSFTLNDSAGNSVVSFSISGPFSNLSVQNPSIFGITTITISAAAINTSTGVPVLTITGSFQANGEMPTFAYVDGLTGQLNATVTG